MHARQRSVDGLTVRACLRCAWFDLTLDCLLTLFFFLFCSSIIFYFNHACRWGDCKYIDEQGPRVHTEAQYSSIYAHATTDYSTYATYAISQKGCGPVVGDPNIPVQVQWKLVVCFNSSPTKMRQGMLPLPRSKKKDTALLASARPIYGMFWCNIRNHYL